MTPDILGPWTVRVFPGDGSRATREAMAPTYQAAMEQLASWRAQDARTDYGLSSDYHAFPEIVSDAGDRYPQESWSLGAYWEIRHLRARAQRYKRQAMVGGGVRYELSAMLRSQAMAACLERGGLKIEALEAAKAVAAALEAKPVPRARHWRLGMRPWLRGAK